MYIYAAVELEKQYRDTIPVEHVVLLLFILSDRSGELAPCGRRRPQDFGGLQVRDGRPAGHIHRRAQPALALALALVARDGSLVSVHDTHQSFS